MSRRVYSGPQDALIEHDLRWYTLGTQDVRNEPFAASAAKRKIPVFTGLVAFVERIQRRLRGTLKAVARVRIPSGLHPLNPPDCGGFKSLDSLIKVNISVRTPHVRTAA